ncbi:MAG: hypothetical protein JWM11_4813 [Planctomycetaceae bacterium]|nr:hypothetical protein [Planctomycetaceae bacterium]
MPRNVFRKWCQQVRRQMQMGLRDSKRRLPLLSGLEVLEDRTLLSPTISLVANIENDNFKAQFLPTSNGLFIAVTGFGTPDSLYKTDGTSSGTVLLHHFTTLYSLGFSVGAFSQEFNGVLYFSADDGDNGNGLWKTDGTPEGTVLVTNVAASPENLTVMNGQLYFSGYDSIHGRELWTSDGTGAGTHLLDDIIPGTAGSLDDGDSTDIVPFQGKLYFGVETAAGESQIWTSDGTAGGTQMKDLQIASSPGQLAWTSITDLAEFNNRLIFKARQDVTSGVGALWVSDGTTDGTVPLNQVAGSVAGTSATTISDPTLLGQIDGVLYFSPTTDDPASNLGLWATDGTLAGTRFIKNPGAPNTFRSNFGQLAKGADGQLYFSARDAGEDTELWVTDGTTPGTHRLVDISPGDLPKILGGGPASSDPGGFVPLDGQTYFYADVWKQGTELWKTDGTASGTVLVKDLLPGRYGSYPYTITEFHGGLLFITEEPNFALWKLTPDGSASGGAIPPQHFTLPENASLGTVVGMLSGTNFASNQKPIYAITAGNSAAAFSIDPKTGRISVADASQLDFETSPTFELTVQATLRNGAPASGTVTITLSDQPEIAAVTLDQASLAIPNGTTPTRIDPSASIDLAGDSPASLSGTQLVIGITAGRQSADRLSILGQGTAADQLQVKGKTLRSGMTTIGVITGGKGKAANLVVTFNAAATLNEVQETLRQVSFSTKSHTAGSVARRAVIQVLNLGGKNSTAAHRDLRLP